MTDSADPSLLRLPNPCIQTDPTEESVRQLLPLATEVIDDVQPATTQSSEPVENDQQPPPVITSASAQAPPPPQTGQAKQIVVHRPANVDRLDYFAFSHNADAYCHGVEAKWTRGTILTVATRVSAASGSDNVQKIPSLEPTPEELHPTPDHLGVHGYLWVGMTPSDETIDSLAESPAGDATADASDDKSKDTKKKKPKLQGKKHRRDLKLASSTDEEIRILPKDESALRVVVNLRGKNMSLLKLSNRDNTSGTCTSESVKADNVFFFRVFRKDDATGVGERRNFFKETFTKLRDAMEKDGSNGVAKALKAMAPVAASGGQTQRVAASGSKNSTKKPRAPRSDKTDPPQTATPKSAKGNQGTKRKNTDTGSSTPQAQAGNEAAKSKKQKMSNVSTPVSLTATNGKSTTKSKALPPTELDDNAGANPGNKVDQQLAGPAKRTRNDNDSSQQYGIVNNGYPISALPGTPDFPRGSDNSQVAAPSPIASNDTDCLSSTSTLQAPGPSVSAAMASPTPTRPASLPGRGVGFSSSESHIIPPVGDPSAFQSDRGINALKTTSTMWNPVWRSVKTSMETQSLHQMNDEAELGFLEQEELEQQRIQYGVGARNAQQQQSWQQLFRHPQSRCDMPTYLGQASGQFFQESALKKQHPQKQDNTRPNYPWLQQKNPLGPSKPNLMQNIQSSSVRLPKQYDTAEELFTPLGRHVVSLVSSIDRHSKSNVNTIKYATTMIDQLSNITNSSSLILQLRLSPPAPSADIKTVLEPMLSDLIGLFPELAQELNRETFSILLYALRVSDKTVEYEMVPQFIYGFTRELANQRADKGDEHALHKENLYRIVQGAINIARDLVYHRNNDHRQGVHEQQRQTRQIVTVDNMAEQNSPNGHSSHKEYHSTRVGEIAHNAVDNTQPYTDSTFATLNQVNGFENDT
ncbi:hypothetical protein PpBr36_00651 [Pyricularia pennisetigena]|uniref:hypothetical protein n=1 Tax=Pyricularia pennisetigena TaxID=1578925 RepID=UPI00114F207B|nr:hypothetical protein PpBr36_00651 [Pyricularia pennisetigena]TLS28501.1 hypothetical protein PpBr36_00651 [Pyricularia pennisetigena]